MALHITTVNSIACAAGVSFVVSNVILLIDVCPLDVDDVLDINGVISAW